MNAKGALVFGVSEVVSFEPFPDAGSCPPELVLPSVLSVYLKKRLKEREKNCGRTLLFVKCRSKLLVWLVMALS